MGRAALLLINLFVCHAAALEPYAGGIGGLATLLMRERSGRVRA